MFSDIHKNYDLMNHVLSLGVDVAWRRKAAEESVIDKTDYRILDLASGTGDLAIAMGRACSSHGVRTKILGIDFNDDMLKIAKRKIKNKGLNITFEHGDALNLRFPKDSFEIVASAFGLRNFDSLERFAKEAHRVLKKSGKLILMDMAAPDHGLMRKFFWLYSKVIILEGALIDREAYSFLVNSIKRFDKNKFVKILENQGFKDIKLASMPSGMAFLVTARK
jgi:demethylmenaquinone methyltransferase/2-methoxy-6-polyprenyl-1,4-benzoquinol methylase